MLLRKILVIQPWGIGDLLMTTPMLQALHGALPEARIDVVVGFAEAAEVLREATYACVRGIVRRQSVGLRGLLRFFLSLRPSHYDAAIVATRIQPLMGQFARFAAGIPIVVGDGTMPKVRGYTAWRAVDPERHRVDANLDIARLVLDLPDAPGPRFDIAPEARPVAAELWTQLGFGERPVLAVHPGCSDRSSLDRRPPFNTLHAALGAVLAHHPESRVLVILGPAEESLRPLFENRDERIRVVSNIPLHVTASLLTRCRSLIAGDSGIGHLASAVGIPVITLAGPTQVKATRPRGGRNVVVRTRERLSCMPCYDTRLYDNCPYGKRCLTSLLPEDILRAITPTLQATCNQSKPMRSARSTAESSGMRQA